MVNKFTPEGLPIITQEVSEKVMKYLDFEGGNLQELPFFYFTQETICDIIRSFDNV